MDEHRALLHPSHVSPARRMLARAIRGALTIGLLHGALVAPASAQTLCPPDASGVPAAGGGPKWFDANGNGVFPEYPAEDDRITDPRWQFATARSDNNTQSVFFRAIREGSSYLDLSWEFADDPSIEAGSDGVYVGFIPPPSAAMGAVNDTIVFKVFLNTNATVSASTSYTAGAIRYSGGSWTGGAQPGWLTSFTRVWIAPGPSNYAGGGMGTWHWAIQMRVPLTTTVTSSYTSAIRVGAGAKMFYVVAGQQGPAGPVTDISWPTGLTASYSFGAYTFPPFASWGALSTTGGCSGGISIAGANVGTTNVPTSQIRFTMPAATPMNPNPSYTNLISNTFYIRPTNNTAGTINTGTLKGRLRVANWGIQPDWNDIGAADRSKIWQDIPITAGDEANRGPIPAGTTATAANDIHFNWTVPGCEVYDMMSPRASYPYPDICETPPLDAERWDKRTHRCIYAEIFSTSPYDFANYSVYRNADFVGLSTFTRDFEVTTIGLKSPRGRTRVPVYLMTMAKNMPRQLSREMVARNNGMLLNRDLASQLERAAAGAPYDARQLETFAPTYTIRGFYGTGDSTEEGGHGRFPIAKPGNSITTRCTTPRCRASRPASVVARSSFPMPSRPRSRSCARRHPPCW